MNGLRLHIVLEVSLPKSVLHWFAASSGAVLDRQLAVLSMWCEKSPNAGFSCANC